VNLRDHTGQIRTFDLDKMIEITHGNNPNTSPIFLKIERRDFKSTKKKDFFPFSYYFIFNRSSICTTSITLDTNDKTMGSNISW